MCPDVDYPTFSANLSEEYFSTRQDRAWLFRELPALAEFYAGLVDVIASMSYQVTPEGELRATSIETDPVLGEYCCFSTLLSSELQDSYYFK